MEQPSDVEDDYYHLDYFEDLSDEDFIFQCPRPTTETDKEARLEAADKIIQADLSLHRLEQKAPTLTKFQRHIIEHACQSLFACSMALRLGGI